MKINPKLLLVVNSNNIGDAEPDLSAKLISAFFKVLSETGELPAQIIFMGTGIFLTTDGSPLIDLLKQMEQAGSQISSCGTCLSYYKRTELLKIGVVGNMKDTVGAMLKFEKVVQL